MFALAAFACTVSLVLGCFISIRLFALARRTGAQPERLLAIAFGSLTCIGYPLAGLSRAPGLSETSEGSLIFALGIVAMAVGIFCFARFPAIVFRPTNSWAAVLSFGIATAGALSGIACAIAVATADTRAEVVAAIQPGALGLMASVGWALSWNAVESFLYYAKMKRRIPLGLADVTTTHRFLLWGIAGAFGSMQILVIIAIRASGLPILSPIPAMVVSMTALVTSLFWWTAFFMPESYKSLLEGGRKSSSAAEA